MPQVNVEPHHRIKPKNLAMIRVGVILLVVVGVPLGIALWYFSIPTPVKAVEKATKLGMTAHYADAEAVLKRSQTRAHSNADKALLLEAQATIATNKNNIPGALDYYARAEQLVPGKYSVELNAGGLAERLGRKAEAIAWYTKAKDSLSKVKRTGGMQQETPEALQLRIEALKK